jgi:hypothetical protein
MLVTGPPQCVDFTVKDRQATYVRTNAPVHGNVGRGRGHHRVPPRLVRPLPMQVVRPTERHRAPRR